MTMIGERALMWVIGCSSLSRPRSLRCMSGAPRARAMPKPTRTSRSIREYKALDHAVVTEGSIYRVAQGGRVARERGTRQRDNPMVTR